MTDHLDAPHSDTSSTDASPPDAAVDPGAELLGAVDIVAAFTSLRHELKLQVRGGRELQQTLCESLQRVERQVAALQPPGPAGAAADNDSRALAEAVVEIEESLQRAVDALDSPSAADSESLAIQFERAVSRASWTATRFAAKLLAEIRELLERSASESARSQALQQATRRGLELLLARVQRLMQQCELERVDVLRQPFDAELMNAVDVVESSSVPASHVAEQLRPAYLWRGKVMRCADVRIAR